jgi:D-glycero-D-manno-heptose 1,7-bisphosphate phosphatase
MSLRRAVFLADNGIVVPGDASSDRDGRGPRLLPAAGPGLRLLRDAGFVFHVIGNRPCVARGECEEDELRTVAQRYEELLEDEGVALTGCSFCPHDPRGVRRDYAVECLCRLPRPGLLQLAAHQHGLDVRRSWLIGDSLDEIEAGVRAGCRTVLLDDGREREWRLSELRLPHHVAEGLGEAALLILEDEHVLDWRRRAAAGRLSAGRA